VYLLRRYVPRENEMRTRVQKWGHSLAIRIPKSFAEEAGLEENVPVEMSLAEGKLLIEPIAKGDLTLCSTA
jgi:antitoxin MazE